MLAWSNLRVDPNNGSAVEEYRIVNGQVEKRILNSGDDFGHDPEDRGLGDQPTNTGGWKRLTREQLALHVETNTAVALWLQRRMGVHRLIRACAPLSYVQQFEVELAGESHAA